MIVPVSVVFLQTDRPVLEGPAMVRGYVGSRFPEYPLLHQHAGERLVYAYPRVQYRVIDGVVSLFGIAEGAEVVREVAGSFEELRLGKSVYEVSGCSVVCRDTEFGWTDHFVKYRFLTPWIALNEENKRRYLEMSTWKERKGMLNRILTGNCLSMAKSLGYCVDKRLFVHSLLEQERVSFKQIGMTGFSGVFQVNMMLPDFAALGKAVSHGTELFCAFRIPRKMGECLYYETADTMYPVFIPEYNGFSFIQFQRLEKNCCCCNRAARKTRIVTRGNTKYLMMW